MLSSASRVGPFSSLPSSASARRPCRAALLRVLRPPTSDLLHRSPALLPRNTRAGLLLCCAMTGPPTGTTDTEAAALEAAAAAAAPPSDVQS
jgi:hypothetical protein